MGVVLVLTPVLISSWPAISAAVAGAAAAMGLLAKDRVKDELKETQSSQLTSIEMELENSQVASDNLSLGQEIVLTKGNIEIHVTRDERGRCSICTRGTGYSKAELKQVAEEFSGKVTQAFIYNRVKTELKNKGFQVVNEEVAEDQTVRIHVRHWED
jgi:hypothetical protein